MKLWGGRFETGPGEVFERFSNSLDFDRRLIEADIRGSQAFARALEQVGILTGEERAQIVEAFDAILEESRSAASYEGAADEDVHTLVIRKLGERAGKVADKIHTGRNGRSLDVRPGCGMNATGSAPGRRAMESLVTLGDATPTRIPATPISAAPRQCLVTPSAGLF